MSKKVPSLLVATLAGIAMSAFLAVFVFAFFPGSRALAVWLAPGLVVEPLLRAVIPGSAVRWLIPQGGPAAEFEVVLIGAVLVWSILLGSIFGAGRAWWRRRREAVAPVTSVVE